MTDIRDRAAEWLTKVNAWHPDVNVSVRQVEGRLVPCEVPGCTTLKDGDVSYGRDAVRPWRDHDHWTPYETPHERIVIMLPVEEANHAR